MIFLLLLSLAFADTQATVDRYTSWIFDSPVARKKLCFLTHFGTDDIENFLGVSKKAAADISKKCGSRNLPPHQLRGLEIMRNRIFETETRQPPKRYSIDLLEAEYPALQAFSAKNGVTAIQLNRSEADDETMLRIFAHELATTFDQLGAHPQWSHTQDWEYGLEFIFGLDFPIFEEPRELGAIRCALRDPAVRYAMSTERAFRFEDQVARELGMTKTRYAIQDTCARTIGRRALDIAVIAPLISRETEAHDLYMNCGGIDLMKDAKRGETLAGRIRTIANTTLKFRHDGTELPLCDLVLTPQIGPLRPENVRHGGPRPRVGGWLLLEQ